MAVHANQVLPPLTSAERAARSVFVGNIPYEATEEQLKEIFNQAGPVVSFRLVYDRETGKPKGYGFCEYQDIETAQSAMRNLNNYDFNGRPLRVGVAAGEQNKEEAKGMQQAVGGIPIESPYGDPVEPEKAPEAISKAVASLPPEQMFELMKQMKLCIQNNPTEARNMLLQNPQLAYALLQAQIVMKIVDPQVALTMLHREPNQVPLSQAPAASTPTPVSLHGPPTAPPRGGPGPASAAPHSSSPGMGLGHMPPHSSPHMHAGGPMPERGPYQGHMGGPQGGAPAMGRREIPAPGYPGAGSGPPPKPEHRDPRIPTDPRTPMAPRLPPASQPPASRPSPTQGIPGLTGLSMGPGGVSSQDQEKAALIMQVLQLTDAQIAVLPPEQRQSILILKEQIAKSQ